MNEQIKELAIRMNWEEMGQDLYGKSMDGCMTSYALEKFTELIVRDCTNIVLYYADVNEGVAAAKKHFGVK